jgi:ferrous iron transport protein B
MDWIDGFCGWLGGMATALIPEGNIQDLIVDGIIGGVGGVVVFLPNILILFFGISIMEDTGYMARAAFIMDKIMHKMGLHGKSFVPVIMGLGCNVPAIMAARTLESQKDRIKTILLAPLISCSARMPVYILFAAALFPEQAGNIVFLFQFVFSIGAFFLMGVVFKKTILRGEEVPFVMELPPYRLPTFRSVVIHMWQKAGHYLKKMGGVVLVFSIILWFAGTFPKYPDIERKYEDRISQTEVSLTLSDREKEAEIQALRDAKASEIMSKTYIGRIGTFLEPVVKPLGFDWRGAVSLITGFVAKEVVVSSMGVLYAVGEEEDSESSALQKKIAENFTPLTGFGFMMFVLLYTPCIVALVTLIRELRSWKWSLFSIGYQLVLAYLMALIIYQGGKLLGLA